MKALGAFVGSFFGLLCALELVAILVFGWMEPKWGAGTNFAIAVVLFAPAAVAAAFGYAISAYIRDRIRDGVKESYLCATLVGAVTGLLGFAGFVVASWVELPHMWLLYGPFLILGLAAPLLCWVRGATNAA